MIDPAEQPISPPARRNAWLTLAAGFGTIAAILAAPIVDRIINLLTSAEPDDNDGDEP